MRQSYKTYLRSVGRKSPPGHDQLRSSHRPRRADDRMLAPAAAPWWLPEHREASRG